jgi:hypothetical protein
MSYEKKTFSGSQNFFDNLVAGKSGIAKMPSWANEMPCTGTKKNP